MKAGGFWTPGVMACYLPVQPEQAHSYDLQRARKREEEEIQPERRRDGNFYTAGIRYKQGHGTQLSELFKNSRK